MRKSLIPKGLRLRWTLSFRDSYPAYHLNRRKSLLPKDLRFAGQPRRL